MADLTRAQAKTILYNLGWRVNTSARLTQAIKDFQAGWNLGAALSVDGKVGPKTSAALRLSEARRRAGRTTASANFSFVTMRCRCGGKYSSCKRIWVRRKTFQMMERYRKANGAFSVVSGCRCPSRNRAIGGSSTSRHLTGLACDVPMTRSVTWVRSKGIATHIGWNYANGRRLVKHIDMGAGYSVNNPLVYRD
jgi:hypothetical protein